MVLALEYLHKLGIVYRDLKPENVMVQENGHIMIVDFDLSTKLSPKTTPQSSPSSSKSDSVNTSNSVSKKRFSPLHLFCNSGISPEDSALQTRFSENSAQTESDTTEKSNSFVGTEEYVAPEIVSGNGHDFAVDWWSLGVVLYEMLYGGTPFRGSNSKETFYRILTKKPELTGEPTPLRDLIKKLLEKDPKQRIELDEIKGHDFFRGIEWESVVQISRPPYIPDVDDAKGKEGISNIDVESVVQGIFGEGESQVENHKGKSEHEKNGNSQAENVNNKTKTWVGGFNHHPTNMDNFLVF